MKHFKNLNPGFTIIESMFALTLLTIFGTSLFMLQTNILFKTTLAHYKVIRTLNLHKLKRTFDTQIFKKTQNNESIDNVHVEMKLKAPDTELSIKTKKIPEQSKLHKKFEKNLYIVHHTAKIDNKKDDFITLLFAPSTEESS